MSIKEYNWKKGDTTITIIIDITLSSTIKLIWCYQ